MCFILSSCSSDKDTVPISESNKLITYLDNMFDAYVDRHPEYQSYLGIKKDYDKWNNISPSAEERERFCMQKYLSNG